MTLFISMAAVTAIGSKALIADSKETLTCAFLSVTLIAGLGENYLFGFWQADPVVGIIIVLFLFRERYEGWTEAGEEGEDEQAGRDTELEPGTPCRSPRQSCRRPAITCSPARLGNQGHNHTAQQI